MTNRLLYIAHRVPYPPDKGERVRAFYEIKALSQVFRVTLACVAHSEADMKSADAMRRWCERVIVAGGGGRVGLLRGGVTLLRGHSVTEGYFYSRHLSQALAAETQRDPFGVVFAYSSGVLPTALDVPAALLVTDLVDVDSAKWLAYADSAPWPHRWVYRREARGVAALERLAIARSALALVVSDAERSALKDDAPNVHAVGNGVDLEYFSPSDPPNDAAPSLVFTGTMSYRPNADGVCWFVREVWPALRQAYPELVFNIVGRDPSRAVTDLAQTPGVCVTGAVADVRPWLTGALMAVAPLRIARGVQNKVLEAMASGRAVVASPAAAEGLNVTPGGDIAVADSPREWVEAIGGLIEQPQRRREMARAARLRVERDYTWAAQMDRLVSLVGEAALAGGHLSEEALRPQRPVVCKTPAARPVERSSGS